MARIHYADMTEWTNAVRDADRTTTIPASGRSSMTGRFDFTQSASLDEALTLARNGWPEGRERSRKYAARISSLAGTAVRREYESSMLGPLFDMGAYMSGDPEYMLTPIDTVQQAGNGPLVRILIDVSASAGVRAETMITRGAAVVALVEALQASGKRCEVIATYCTGSFISSVTVKEPDQHLNLDSIAFAVAHPSAFRRLTFALMEGYNLPECGGGYGRPIEHPTLTGDIRVPNLSLYDDPQFSDEEHATKYVLSILAKYGVEMQR